MDKVEIIYDEADPCTICKQQIRHQKTQEKQKRRSQFHKDETLYKESDVNQAKSFTWLVEHLTPDIADDLPGGIKVSNYVKGCEVNIPDLAVFANGAVKFIAQTNESGCVCINYESFSLHDIRRMFSVIVRKRKRAVSPSKLNTKRGSVLKPKTFLRQDDQTSDSEDLSELEDFKPK